jgi:hypothetical protein
MKIATFLEERQSERGRIRENCQIAESVRLFDFTSDNVISSAAAAATKEGTILCEQSAPKRKEGGE